MAKQASKITTKKATPTSVAKNMTKKTATKKTIKPVQKSNGHAITFDAPFGKILVIRLSVKNHNLTPLLVRMTLDDWVSNDGNIYSTHNRIEPGYLYILPEGEAMTTLTLLVPENLNIKQTLKSNLRFPGADEDVIPIEVSIVAIEKGKEYPPILENNVKISFPLKKKSRAELKAEEHDDAASKAIFTLVSGLANLSALPSQWLFAEGIVMICIEGEKYSTTKKGEELLGKLSKTRFYKNLTLAFTSARLSSWISSSIISASSLHSAMGGQFGQGRIVYIWLKWLFDLVDMDLEDSDQKLISSNIPQPILEESISKYGNKAEVWAGYLLLGLCSISPKILQIITTISAEVPTGKDKVTRPKKVDNILGEKGPITK